MGEGHRHVERRTMELLFRTMVEQLEVHLHVFGVMNYNRSSLRANNEEEGRRRHRLKCIDGSFVRPIWFFSRF